MNDAPERIFAWSESDEWRSGSWARRRSTKIPVAYVRADLYEALQALVAELEAAVATARDKALEDAAKVAEPQQRKNSAGLWVVRRRKIAAAIRAMKSGQSG